MKTKNFLNLKSWLLMLALIAGSTSVWAADVTLTSEQIKAGNGSSSYGSCSATDGGGNTWKAYAIKNQHSNATSDYNFWQIKKYASNTAYYVQVPTLGSKITQLEITVSSTNKARDGGGNTATLFFSSSNSTSATGEGVVSGTDGSTVTIDCSSLNLNTGYITASGAVRIWDVVVTYEAAAVTTDPTITFNNGSVNVGGTLNLSTLFSSNSSGAVTYSITSGDSYASIDGSILTGVAEGSVTVKATQAAAGTYNAGEKSATITVSDPALSSIAITTAPSKTTYTEGDTFDATGMVVTATFADASTEDVTASCTFTPSGALTTSDTKITVSYTRNAVTRTATQAITVNTYVQPTVIEITPNFTFWGKNAQFSGNDFSELSGSKDNVTLAWSKGEGSTYANSTAMRFYKDNDLKFTAPNGYEIKSIVLTGTLKSDETFSPVGFDTDTQTWTGAANTVTMSRPSSGSSYATISKFTITIGLPSSVASPTFSVAEGTYYATQNVTISCAIEGATIYYTTDGTEPSASNGTQYTSTSAISISTTTTLKAIAIKNGEASAVTSATYTFPATYETIAALVAAAPTDKVILKLTNAQVLYVNNKDMYVKDASGAIDFYDCGLEYAAGTILNGTMVVSYEVYEKTGLPEVTSVDTENSDVTVTEGEAMPVEMSAKDITLANDMSQLVKVKGDYSNTAIDGVPVYNKWKIESIDLSTFEASVASAVGIVVPYNGEPEIALISIEAVPVVATFNGQKFESLQAAIDAAEAANPEDIVIDLLDDATLDIAAWNGTTNPKAIGTASTKSITINGNGHKLDFNQSNSDWNNVATMNDAETKLVLKDMSITNSGHNDGPWNRHDINFNCAVELNNVTSDKALAFKNDATLKNVTVTDNSGDIYGIWISPRKEGGQSISIDGLTVTCGRGIKVDDQYVDDPVLTNLDIKNATFNTTNKSAILVKNAGGTNITAGEGINIENAATDNTNLVWVDEDRAQDYYNVTVTGASMIPEKGEANYAAKIVSGEKTMGYYTTFAAAVEAAEADQVVTLLKDVDTYELADGQTLSLDKNGHNINVTVPEGCILDQSVNENVTTYSSFAGIVINNVEELKAFRDAVNAGTSYAGKTVKLAADLDLSGEANWEPIGNVAAYPGKAFKGTFDGAGHTISHLTIDDQTVNWGRAALFGSASNATIKNLNITDVDIKSHHYASAIVAYKGDDTNVTIENCHVKNGSIVSTPELLSSGSYDNGDKVGAILGYGANPTTIDGCSAENINISGYRDLGSIAGYITGTVTNCTAKDVTIAQNIKNGYKDGDMLATCGEIVGGRSTNAATVNAESSYDNVVITQTGHVAQVGEQKYESLQAALDAAEAADPENIVIDLLDDATLDITAWSGENNALSIGTVNTKSITINGNNHTLNFNQKNSDWNNVATMNDAETKLVLNNMAITNSGHNDGPWNRHDINFNCAVELNNVTSDKALAFKNSATLNNVTVTDNSGSLYGIWIQPNGQNVSINGLNVTAERGIKIDDQYVDSPEKVTLDIANATFNTTKKAAILVKTAAGADITVGDGINIQNVAADNTNLVWVDEARANLYGLVNVTGATMIPEKGEANYTAKIVSGEKIIGYFATLQAAFNAAEAGQTVTLLKDYVANESMAGGTRQFVINKSITFDGGGFTLTTKQRGIGIGNVNSDVAENIDVTIKNVTVLNTSDGARCIDTRGKIGSLTLEGVTLNTQGATANSNTTQPLTIGGNQSDAATVTITNSTIQTNDDATAYYAIITFNPVNMTVTNSTIKGWANVYAKGKDGSAGSAGSVFNLNKCTLVSTNEYSGSSNAFAAFVIGDNNVTINVTNSDIVITNSGDQWQTIAGYPMNNALSGNKVTLGEGNKVKFVEPGQFAFAMNQSEGSEFTVTGGLFSTVVPDEFCAEGLTTVANTDEATKDEYPYAVGVKVEVAAPIVFHDGGTYEEALTVPMIAQAGAEIYYSTDGTTFTKYAQPIEISATTTVTAYAMLLGAKSSEVTKTFTIVAKQAGPSVTDGYYNIKAGNKFVNVAGRKTVTLVENADGMPGTVIRVKATNGKVETLRSQGVDVPSYAQKAMNYVPEIVRLAVDKLHAEGAGELLGEHGLDAIMTKFDESFDYNLYLEGENNTYRIYGRTPSMKPVVDFYAENKDNVDAKLPQLEEFINQAIDKVLEKTGGRGAGILVDFDLETVWQKMGGTLTEPVDEASTAKFYEEVLTSEGNVWNFAYQTAMIYWGNLKNNETFKNNLDKLGDYAKYIDKVENIQPNFKYYIVPSESGVDFISKGNIAITDNDPSVAWTMESVDKFNVNFDVVQNHTVYSTNGGVLDEYSERYTTLYTDFAYTLPDGVKAYKVKSISDKGVAVREEITGTIPAQTPVMLINTDNANSTKALVLSTEDGTSVTGNLLVGADELINQYQLKTSQVESLFNLAKDVIGESAYNEYLSKYEHLMLTNAGTVNNKYFFGLSAEDVEKCVTKNENNEDDCVIRSLSTGEEKIGFYNNWTAGANQAFLISSLNPVKLWLVGDVNRDGDITVTDVTYLVNIILGKATYPKDKDMYDFEAADVDGDETISIADVTKLVNMILGKE